MRRSFLKFTLALTAAALVSGCATGVKHAEMAASMPKPKAGEGRIYFFRPSTFGLALQPNILLNGQLVGQSKAGGFFFVDKPAGKYVASASTETENSLSFTLDPGETKYFRVSIGFGLVVDA